jgi:hypothetical protein
MKSRRIDEENSFDGETEASKNAAAAEERPGQGNLGLAAIYF